MPALSGSMSQALSVEFRSGRSPAVSTVNVAADAAGASAKTPATPSARAVPPRVPRPHVICPKNASMGRIVTRTCAACAGSPPGACAVSATEVLLGPRPHRRRRRRPPPPSSIIARIHPLYVALLAPINPFPAQKFRRRNVRTRGPERGEGRTRCSTSQRWRRLCWRHPDHLGELVEDDQEWLVASSRVADVRCRRP